MLVDWPGFGDSDRPPLEHEPALIHAFLGALAEDLPPGAGIIACGHAAGYALALAYARPGFALAIVLVAPTWRGPLPTAMGEHRRPAYAWVRRAVRAPLLGHLLYRVNTAPPVLRMMMRRHVYGDPATVTPTLVAAKRAVAQRPGARFGPAAFVTGALDPVQNRDAFLHLLSPPPAPTLLLRGEATPPRSAAEMDAAAALPGITGHRVPGALSPHEEYPAEVVALVLPFLRRHLAAAGDGPVAGGAAS